MMNPRLSGGEVGEREEEGGGRLPSPLGESGPGV
jgi:hypothetical protein